MLTPAAWGWGQALEVDLKVIQTILGALKGSGKLFIGTCGASVLADHPGISDESTPYADHPPAVRAKSEQLIISVSALLRCAAPPGRQREADQFCCVDSLFTMLC